MFFWSRIDRKSDKIMIFTYQLHFDRSPWLLGVESRNLNWYWISGWYFRFSKPWCATLSSRSQQSSRDRGVIREVTSISFPTWCNRFPWLLGAKSWNFNWNEISYHIFIFLLVVATPSSRLGRNSRDRGVTPRSSLRIKIDELWCVLRLGSPLRPVPVHVFVF